MALLWPCPHRWCWCPSHMLYRRLADQYGPERAESIMRGEDEKTEADKAAWQALGSK